MTLPYHHRDDRSPPTDHESLFPTLDRKLVRRNQQSFLSRSLIKKRDNYTIVGSFTTGVVFTLSEDLRIFR